MLKTFTFILLSLAALTSATAQPTRLVGYEEVSLDTAGAINHYIAYWNKFSANRGSVVAPLYHVGLIYPEMIVDASAYDTSYGITSRGYGAYKDSSMTVRKYAANNNLLESKTYEWNYQTSAWLPTAKDSFNYASTQLMSRYWFQYDAATATFNYAGDEQYTYDANGKLVGTMKKDAMSPPTNLFETKYEYTWAGNQITDEKAYFLSPVSTWCIQYHFTTTYNSNNKAVRQQDKRWTYHNMTTVVDSIIDYDSNIYNGNDLAWRYQFVSGYPTSGFPFNFRRSYKNDAKGNIIEVQHDVIDIAGVWHNFNKHEISFNGDNNPTLVKEYDWDSTKGWRLAWRGNPTYKYYHYEKFPTSVPTICTSGISLYPSPAQHNIHVKTEFDKETECNFAIIDMQGRLVRQWSERAQGGEDVTIPISSLPDGTYLLRLSAQGQTTIERFSVMK